MLTKRAGQAGQALPLFAILSPMVLAFMALGLDAANAMVERRDAQGAADLAALAGARLIHEGATLVEQAAAEAKAVDVAAANGYPSSQVTAQTPHDGSDEKILVTIDSDVDTYFAPILDLIVGGSHASIDVDARAVAYGGYEEAGAGQFAIFALESCPSLQKTVDISGSGSLPTSPFTIVGRVHSNSDLYISGSNIDFVGPTTYSCGTGYPAYDEPGSGNTYVPAPTSGSSAPSPEPDPVALTRSDFTCDFIQPGSGMWDLSSNGSWWVGGTKVSKTLRAGTYCSGTGSNDGIKLGDSSIRVEDVISGPGGVTFVAQWQIDISGSNFILTPHEHNVLFFSSGNHDSALKLQGSGGAWTGILYAPNGTAQLNGSSNLTVSGGVVSERVQISGSSLSITGTAGDGGPGEQVIALTE